MADELRPEQLGRDGLLVESSQSRKQSRGPQQRRFYQFCRGLLPLLLWSLGSPLSAPAMDRRTPIDILPNETQSLQLIWGTINNDSKQYAATGQKVSETDNTATVTKLLYRNTLLPQTEFALEVPYLLKRHQRQTAANGVTTTKYDASGLGDISVQVTRQWQAPGGKWGGIVGLEAKFPSGDESKGLGSGGYDLVGRLAVSRKSYFGRPYAMLLYTMSGHGKVNNVVTDAGDDLYAAIGIKSPAALRLSVDARGGVLIRTTGVIQESNGSAAHIGKYEAPFCLIEARALLRAGVDLKVSYEAMFPEDHSYTVNGRQYVKDPGRRDQIVVALGLAW